MLFGPFTNNNVLRTLFQINYGFSNRLNLNLVFLVNTETPTLQVTKEDRFVLLQVGGTRGRDSEE